MFLKVVLKGNRIMTEIIHKAKMELEDYYGEIGCDIIEVTSLNENIAIVSDEEGLFKASNPVYEIGNLKIPGTLIIGKDVMTDEGMEVQGFKSLEDIRESLGEVQIGIFGFTKSSL